VGIHALWNSMSVAMVALPLALQTGSPLSGALAEKLPVGVLGIIYLSLFFILLWANRRLSSGPIKTADGNEQLFTTEHTESTEVE
jgi:hypothetical protein